MKGEERIDLIGRDLGLWLAILGPPAVWLVQFQTIYVLVYKACVDHRSLIISGTAAAFFVVIALLGVAALREWNRTRQGENVVSRTRRFMSRLGLASTLLFLIVLVAQWLAALMLDPCAT
jgi:hypothetical protein